MVVLLVESLYLSYYYVSYRIGLGHRVHVGVVGGSMSIMDVVGETRSRAVVVVSNDKARCTALYSFYFIYVPGSVWVP